MYQNRHYRTENLTNYFQEGSYALRITQSKLQKKTSNQRAFEKGEEAKVLMLSNVGRKPLIFFSIHASFSRNYHTISFELPSFSAEMNSLLIRTKEENAYLNMYSKTANII